MPRSKCPRTIAHSSVVGYFKPAGIPLYDLKEVTLGSDELEAIRLVDCEDLYHAEAAERMGVSRQTFDRIINAGRKQVAQALVKGLALKIQRHQ